MCQDTLSHIPGVLEDRLPAHRHRKTLFHKQVASVSCIFDIFQSCLNALHWKLHIDLTFDAVRIVSGYNARESTLSLMGKATYVFLPIFQM